MHFFLFCRAYIKNMESKVTGCTGNQRKRQEKYGHSSSVNDSLNDKCENLSEKNRLLYSENEKLKKDKIKIEKEKDEALSR